MDTQIIGNCLLHEITPHYLHLHTQTHSLSVSINKSGAFKCTFGMRNLAHHQPTIAIENDTLEPLNCAIDSQNAKITAPFGSLQISLNPIRLLFFNNQGEPILRSDNGLGLVTQKNTATAYWSLEENNIFVGLGEKPGPINKKGLQFTNWNTDAFAYNAETDPLYASIPFYQSINKNGIYGIFVDQSERTDFNFGASNHRFSFCRVHSTCLTFYVFTQQTHAEILTAYSKLTGFTPLPPLWALGYQQCRYSYYPASEITLLADTFRKKQIPADVLYLDIHYMEDYKVFTFHPTRFDNPQKLIEHLSKEGFEVVPIIDPGIKIEPGYTAYETGLAENQFLTYPDGENYIGEAWPGKCHFPDFTAAKTRAWWANYVAEMSQNGISGFWNDMNEPAVWGKHFPDVISFNLDNKPNDHFKAHNVYGQYMAIATRQGAEQGKPDKRIFVLTRAAFAGIQRTATLWTGDNMSNEEHFWAGIRLVLNIGLSGVPLVGNDVGGFIGEAWPQLFARWVQVAAFMPFFRGHTMINSRDAEPWSFGEETEEISRNYISLRYKLMPQWYSWVKNACLTGEPICMPLFYHFSVEKAYHDSFQHQFLVGNQLLVCPIAPSQQFLKVWLPETKHGFWYELFTDVKVLSGEHILEPINNELPVFVMPGSLILAQETLQNTKAMQTCKTLQLHCYLAKKGSFQTKWYMDDGNSLAYKKGNYIECTINYLASNNSIHFTDWHLGYDSNVENLSIYFHGMDAKEVYHNGQLIPLSVMDHQWVEPISSFDPYFTGVNERLTCKGAKILSIKFKKSDFTINWK